jgi:hypothetical protein
VTKVKGPRSVTVKVQPHGPYWHRHIEQLRPRYPEDDDPWDISLPEVPQMTHTASKPEVSPKADVGSNRTEPVVTSPKKTSGTESTAQKGRRNPRLPIGDEYGPGQVRKSDRVRRPAVNPFR